ncbi:MAG: hypothetical protein ABSE77_16345, partial [Acidimicrobiales bacterium]
MGKRAGRPGQTGLEGCGVLSGIISTDAARAERSEKGLKGGTTLGLLSSTVVGVASTAKTSGPRSACSASTKTSSQSSM